MTWYDNGFRNALVVNEGKFLVFSMADLCIFFLSQNTTSFHFHHEFHYFDHPLTRIHRWSLGLVMYQSIFFGRFLHFRLINPLVHNGTALNKSAC